MEFDDHLTCSWSAVELINRVRPTMASVEVEVWHYFYIYGSKILILDLRMRKCPGHIVVIDAFEAEEFAEVATKPLKALPYDTPG
ncbi:hypothetical protein HanRHA438_Chr09g0399191 [Helianthus annuus]|nr:hypothetical protein HanHA300_Chr09g0318301 [Helianthus annuus]KAJ0534286.1 hypothetical protein HanIR_Chr09g0417981 [Helianthus annuus]KAJ0542395.1 hypothetical protein HanHA89_Chr09g0339271 [Helianthus annuus]KAJ0707436.1 hypothetical protein HanLR1_Chr09g0318411 [Helianthus annuus]KAJ0888187.1 hypothetical protein HanRHA438_Chr09g0399191 [Helianthus annuus]